MKRQWTHLNERRNGNYRYVRDFPTKLPKAIPSHPKQFCKEPGLAYSCTDGEFHRAMDSATASSSYLHAQAL